MTRLSIVLASTLAPLAAAAALATTACSSSAHPPPPTAPADSGAADVDAEVATEAGDAGPETTPGDTGAPTDGADASDASDGAGDAPVGPTAPTCALPTKLGAGVALAALSTGDDELLGTVTPDERTLAWLVFDDVLDGAAPARLRVADRARREEAFAGYAQIELPEGGVLAGGIALSPDGLRLVYVTADGRALRQLSRAARGEAFQTQADEGPFETIARMVADSPGNRVSDPVLGWDDRTLYYVLEESMATHIRRATRAASGAEGAWTSGDPLLESDLRPDGALRARPTGVSADGLVLFVFGEATGHAYAAMRDEATGHFEKLTDLGPRRALTASADCARVYYSAPGPSGDLDLWTAAAP